MIVDGARYVFFRTFARTVREKLVGTTRRFDEISLLKEELKIVQKNKYECCLICPLQRDYNYSFSAALITLYTFVKLYCLSAGLTVCTFHLACFIKLPNFAQ
jgi:hypothetical protein